MDPKAAKREKSQARRPTSARPAPAQPGLSVSRGPAANSPPPVGSEKGGKHGDRSETPPTHSPEAHPTLPPTRRMKMRGAIRKRAEHRAKVPHKFQDSFKRFFFSPTGMLKVVRMSLIIAAVVCFLIGQANETFIAITIQETCIVLFFIVIYLVTLQHLLICLHWPLVDLINSFISTVFLSVVAILSMQEKGRRHLYYVGGVLCLSAAVLCLVDALLVTKTMRNNLKRALGLETKDSPDAAPEQKSSSQPPAPAPSRGHEAAGDRSRPATVASRPVTH